MWRISIDTAPVYCTVRFEATLSDAAAASTRNLQRLSLVRLLVVKETVKSPWKASTTHLVRK